MRKHPQPIRFLQLPKRAGSGLDTFHETAACPYLYVRLAKPMNCFAASVDPRAEKGQRNATMTKDEMIGLFKSAPMGSRHQRMLWAAHKIAGLTGATEGGTFQMLLVALIEAEKQLDPWEFNDCA
jgi:hypothetical protein